MGISTHRVAVGVAVVHLHTSETLAVMFVEIVLGKTVTRLTGEPASGVGATKPVAN